MIIQYDRHIKMLNAQLSKLRPNAFPIPQARSRPTCACVLREYCVGGRARAASTGGGDDGAGTPLGEGVVEEVVYR